MLAYFGTDVDWGKGAVGVDVDGVMGVGVEGGDEVWGCGGVEVLGLGDVIEELAIDELLGQEPNLMTLLVVYCVLIRVSVGREARRGGKEVFKWADVDCGIKYWGRERSGCRQGRGSNGGDGSCNDGWGDILEGDVLERDVVDQVLCELKVAPTVLVEWGEESVKFCLGEADDVGGGFFSELFKVELGSGAQCLLSGLRSRW